MPTVSSHVGFKWVTVILWVASCCFIGLALLGILTLPRRVDRSQTPVLQESRELARAIELMNWRSTPEFQEIVRSMNAMTTQITLPDRPPVRADSPINATVPDDATPLAQRFVSLVLQIENRNCELIEEFSNRKNALIPERDALLLAHAKRVDQLAIRFPGIRKGMTSFLAEFDREHQALLATLSATTITTTRDGRRDGETSALSHWRYDVDGITKAVESCRDTPTPYRGTFLAERACEALNNLQSKFSGMSTPRSPGYRLP